ncbi:hypothetical protein AMJ80_03275 [bacterium SM23_31]|nr:MAG: hypothetical protein AMJ80_03275 [bacterium SM23_31]
MKNTKVFLKPETLSRLSNLEIRARLVVEGFITGLHKSPYHGFSVEFAEHRQYMPGDEIKHIDWKVLGKTDRYYVKQYEEETNLKSYILLDVSGSMLYGSGKVTKIEYASYLAASLTYLMLKQRDSVGLALFSDKILKYVPPRSVQTYLIHILREIENIEPQGKTNVSPAFHLLAEKIKRRGLVIIISDLFDVPDKIVSGLKHFRHKKHEVLLFHILDPYEVSFAFNKESVFLDIETGEEINTLPWHIRRDYRRQVKDMLYFYQKFCRENRIDYVLMNTETELDKALSEYLIKRKRLY